MINKNVLQSKNRGPEGGVCVCAHGQGERGIWAQPPGPSSSFEQEVKVP